MATTIILMISFVANILLGYALVRFIKRTMEFDNILYNIIDDVELNIEFFNQLLATPTFTNSPEVKALHGNMKIIRDRFLEYIDVYDEVSPNNQEDLQTGE